MKTYKDYLYDWNDVLVVLAILLVAAGLIVWRVAVIVDYPKTLAEQSGADGTTQDSAVDPAPADTTDKADNAENDSAASDSTSSLWSNGALTADVTVVVASGSATGAVQSLVDAKLFESYAEFEQVCKAAGYTPENIKATTYTFKSGSTQTDIAKKVTQ